MAAMGAACGKEGGAAGEPISDAGKTSQPQPASVSKAEASDMGLAGEGSAASTGDGGASAALDDGGRAALQKQVTSKMKTKRVREVYKLGKTLGTGGFSVVKLAVDRTTGDEYACKVMALPPPGAELDDYSNTREDIIKEIEILCTMEHPSIIYLKEFYDENNKVYLITELLTGGELLDAVLARGSYTEEDARVCFGKLLSALGYLHEQKIAHRDLKLENLLLVDSSDITNIKLADFGLAKVSAAQAQMQTVRTPLPSSLCRSLGLTYLKGSGLMKGSGLTSAYAIKGAYPCRGITGISIASRALHALGRACRAVCERNMRSTGGEE